MTHHRRRLVALTVLTAAVAAFTMSAFAEPPEGRPSTITGAVTVTDGDTIKVDDIKIRLNGFDTPEKGSVCGGTDVYQKASDALVSFAGSRDAKCKLTGEKSFDRYVGTCSVSGRDIGTFMVESGWGRDWPKFSDGKYAAAEKTARSAKRGLWGLNCADGLWGNRSYD